MWVQCVITFLLSCSLVLHEHSTRTIINPSIVGLAGNEELAMTFHASTPGSPCPWPGVGAAPRVLGRQRRDWLDVAARPAAPLAGDGAGRSMRKRCRGEEVGVVMGLHNPT